MTLLTGPSPDQPLDLGSMHAAVQALANAVHVVSSPEFAAAGAPSLLAQARALLRAIESRNRG